MGQRLGLVFSGYVLHFRPGQLEQFRAGESTTETLVHEAGGVPAQFMGPRSEERDVTGGRCLTSMSPISSPSS